MEEALSVSLRMLDHFPRPLHIYVLFLEAVDSFRLNSHLTSRMTALLLSLAQPSLTGHTLAGGALGHRATAAAALALFLSYLTFGAAAAGGGGGSARPWLQGGVGGEREEGETGSQPWPR